MDGADRAAGCLANAPNGRNVGVPEPRQGEGVDPPGREFEFSEIFVQHRTAIGRKIWAIAEGYIPSGGISGDRKLTPHETACILNAGDEDAQITITLYFTDREPVGPYRVRVPARRTLHLQFNDLRDPEPVPLDTDYASVIESNVPIVVQHTRLDSRDPNIALLSTIAFAADGSG
jgi:hypothetical protein